MNRVIYTPPPGFVKLPRSLLAEEWAHRPQTLAVFVRLLLSANRESKDWHGVTVKRGQVLTSYRSLSKSCGLTVSAIRTALEALQKAGAAHLLTHKRARPKMGEAAHLAAQGYTLITICDFDNYEGFHEDSRTPQRTPQEDDSEHLNTQSIALTKEDKEIIDISPEFVSIVEEWLSYKKERREAYKSKRSLVQFYSRLITLSNGDPQAARKLIHTAMANNWAGIFPERTTSTPKARARIDIPAETAEDFKSTL